MYHKCNTFLWVLRFLLNEDVWQRPCYQIKAAANMQLGGVVFSARRGAKEGRPSGRGRAINMNRNREIGRPSLAATAVGGWVSQPSLVPAVAKKEERGTLI